MYVSSHHLHAPVPQAGVPARLRRRGPLELPVPRGAEADLAAYLDEMLSASLPVRPGRSFLGDGCYRHQVPAVAGGTAGRSEFLTSFAGEPYEDLGRFQALWEYQSLMGELLDVEVVNVPVHDGSLAAAIALRMAGRITGRRRLVLAGAVPADRLFALRDYVRGAHELVSVPAGPDAVRAELAAGDAAAVYAAVPDAAGRVGSHVPDLVALAHEAGALAVIDVNPLSLGVLAPPASYGADLTCGDLRPLGVHPGSGGGHAGFIGSQGDEHVVAAYPDWLFGRVPTTAAGAERIGTAAALHGIAVGAYLSLMGPHGMRRIGEAVLANTAYARLRLSQVPGIAVHDAAAVHFADFTVRYGTSRTASGICRALLERGIHGGTPIGEEGARYSVTEVHTRSDIDDLADALEEIVR